MQNKTFIDSIINVGRNLSHLLSNLDYSRKTKKLIEKIEITANVRF